MNHFLLHPFPGDLRVFEIFNQYHSRLLDKIMLFLTTAGEWAIIWVLIAGIIFIFEKKNGRRVLFDLLLAIIFSSFVNDILLKFIFFRERPYLALSDIQQLGHAWHNSSFVSGHTSASFAAAFILFRFYPKWSLLFLLLALSIGFSRIYAGMHYPSDVLGGIIVGVISAWLVLKIDRKDNKKRL